MDMWI
jgi:hypothetical protein